MSIEVMNCVWKHAPVQSGEFAVLLALADYADDNGSCYPSVSKLARKARLKERQTQNCLRSLTEAGFIRTEIGTGPKGSNRYFVETRAIIAKSICHDECAGGANIAPVQSATDGVQSSAPRGAMECTQTIIEPPVEPSAAAAREKSDLESLTSKLIDATGDKIQPHGALVLAPILGLLEAGCDLETDILPTIRTLSARLKRPAGSWAYFVGAIREAYEARVAAGHGLSQPKARKDWIDGLSPDEARAKWAKTLRMAWSNETWISWLWGPPPGQPGCRVPPDMLTEKDRKMDWFIEGQEKAA